MFSVNSASLLKKREGILGQFQKALSGLLQINEAIDGAQEECDIRCSALDDQLAQEILEKQELQRQKSDNERTMNKLSEFLK